MNEEIEKLKTEKKKLEFLIDSKSQTDTLEGQIAIDLHRYKCKMNHEDQCGWHREVSYSEHTWDSPSHHQYLMLARKLISKLEN